MTRARVLVGLLVVALVAVAVAVVVWRATPFGPTDEPGRVRVLDVAAYGPTYEVMLPSGRLDLVVGPRTASLAGEYVDGSSSTDDVQAGRGDSLLPLSWSLDTRNAPVSGDEAEPFALTVVAGDERYDLGALDRLADDPSEGPIVSRGLVVAVEGDADPDDLAVEVTYDGQTQRLDVGTGEVEAGAAAGLYEPRSYAAKGHCGQRPAGRSGFGPSFVGCQIGPVTLTPYRPGLGWVEDAEHAWAVVPVVLDNVSLGRLTDDGYVDYRPIRRRGSQGVRLDGADPAQTTLDAPISGYGYVSGVAVFEVAGDPQRLTVERDLPLGAPYSDAPDERVRLTQDLALEPA